MFTGGFPAQYGGRLSSVLNVRSAEEERRLSGLQEKLYELDNRIKLGEAEIEHQEREAGDLEERGKAARAEIVGLCDVDEEALAIAAKHGCHPLPGVATYEDIYKLSYLRGPSGIIVMLAQDLTKT